MAKAILSSGLELEYETFGSDENEPLILIMGLAAQMVFWPHELCQKLADQGLYIIRFDNRDVGLSSFVDDYPVPRVWDFIKGFFGKAHESSGYLLKDMANDVHGLMNYLGIDHAHICGASMGGMIAQELAIHHPNKVKSLSLFMTTPGDKRLPKPKLRMLKGGIPRKATTHEQQVANQVRGLQIAGSKKELSPSFEDLAPYVEQSLARSKAKRGGTRQLYAILRSPNRSKQLAKLKTPSLIIHGEADPLIPVEHGYALKKLLPEAQFKTWENLGHDLPKPLFDEFAKLVASRALS